MTPNYFDRLATFFLIAVFGLILGVFLINYVESKKLDQVNTELTLLQTKWNRLQRLTQEILLSEKDLELVKTEWKLSINHFEKSLINHIESPQLKNLHPKIDETLSKLKIWWQLPKTLLERIDRDLSVYLKESSDQDLQKLAYQLGKMDALESPELYFLLNQLEASSYEFFLVESAFIKSLDEAVLVIRGEVEHIKLRNLVSAITASFLLFVVALYFNIKSAKKMKLINELLEQSVEERTEALESTNKELQAIITSFPDLYFYLEYDGKITGYHVSQEELLYIEPDKFIHQQIDEILPPEVGASYIQGVKEIHRGAKIYSLEYALDYPDRSKRFYEARLRPLGGEKVLAIVRDITGRKKALFEAEQAKKSAEQASLVKSQFLANMSHELRTPLNAVTGFAELLDTMVSDETQKSYLKSIKTSARGLLTLINDILDLSKIEANKIELHLKPVSVARVFLEIEQIFALKIKEKKLGFQMHIDERLPTLLLDETRLRQILLNLVGNAVKFTEKGHIILSAKVLETGKRSVDFVVSVEDTGIGISFEDQKTIFDVFSQPAVEAREKYGGTGLGLSITRRLTELMKGEVQLKSRPGSGSTFSIIFRDAGVSYEQVEQDEVSLINPDKVNFASAVVMVVDKDTVSRNLLCEYLKKLKLHCVSSGSGKALISTIMDANPDVIIMSSGFKTADYSIAAKQLKENEVLKNIPLIGLTARLPYSDEENSEDQYFDGYLLKPFNVETLVVRLAQYLQHEGIDELLIQKKATLATIDFRLVIGVDEVKRKLKETILPTFENQKKAMVIEELKVFSDQLLAMGNDHRIPAMTEFAQELSNHIKMFDVIAIEEKLEGFEQDLEMLISHLEDMDG